MIFKQDIDNFNNETLALLILAYWLIVAFILLCVRVCGLIAC